jgi:nitrate/nitrite transporter NarK
MSHELILAVLALLLAMTGLLSAVPMQWSFVTAFLGGSSGAAAIGLINSISNLGGLISPPLIGWLKDRTGSLEIGLLIIAVFAAVSALLALTMPARLVNR